jgi:toxin ParE1/3/4
MPADKYEVRFLKIAEEDFLEIVSYIAADNITAAENLARKIENNLELLSANPKLGRIPREEEICNLGYRYLIIQNYIIFYTLENKTILIHRILHGARNYKTLL